MRGNWLALILLKGDVVLFSFGHCDFFMLLIYLHWVLRSGTVVFANFFLKHRVSIVTL